MYGMLMAGVDQRINTFVFIAATQSLNDWAFLGPQPKSKAAYLKQNSVLELTDYLREVKTASKFFQFWKKRRVCFSGRRFGTILRRPRAQATQELRSLT